jgi:hypothetical protein
VGIGSPKSKRDDVTDLPKKENIKVIKQIVQYKGDSK